MKNEFWIFQQRKGYLALIIDLYDPDYLKRTREERFAELKALLLNEIMDIKEVDIQWEDNGFLYKFTKSQSAIGRMLKIHHLLEEAYEWEWFIPFDERNPALEGDNLVSDESYDNTILKHYKLNKSHT